ncbi:putative alanine aminotransferase 2 [Iris pallida]|uniref:Alanine aminotransferase 2 n=1 Tax=Iris pallida TaxID=29817 RepID=A0AAX6ILZ1_IRIPA|nr:putative alanine aminotransferase 2 [Iris pallida]
MSSFNASLQFLYHPYLVHALDDAFNSLEGVTCKKSSRGAMYLFPRLDLLVIEAAKATKIAPDAFFARHNWNCCKFLDLDFGRCTYILPL